MLKSHQSTLLSVSFYAAVSGQCDWAGGLEQVAHCCEGKGSSLSIVVKMVSSFWSG